MLPKENRVRAQEEFDAVFTAARPVHGTLLTVRHKPGENQTRVGFLVGTRVSSKAVVRNQVKRRLRAIAAGLQGQLKPGLLVVAAKSAAVGQPQEQLEAELVSLLKKAKAL